MYSYEERIRAVKYYISCGCNAALTVRKLGYPSARALADWYFTVELGKNFSRRIHRYFR